MAELLVAHGGDPMEEIIARADCGRKIRWIDVSNPTPFMLAALLCGVGAFLKPRRKQPQREEVTSSLLQGVEPGGHE